LRSISSSWAVTGLRVRNFPDSLVRSFAQAVFGDTIFKGVKADDDEPCRGLKQLRCGLKQRLDFVQLPIHINTEGLKGACRRHECALVSLRGRLEAIRRANCPVVFTGRPRTNGSGDSPRPPFLSVLVNEVSSSRCVCLIHHLFGGDSRSRIHTHVDGPVRLKTKSSVRFVELKACSLQNRPASRQLCPLAHAGRSS